jgi:hypothetical protein
LELALLLPAWCIVAVVALAGGYVALWLRREVSLMVSLCTWCPTSHHAPVADRDWTPSSMTEATQLVPARINAIDELASDHPL